MYEVVHCANDFLREYMILIDGKKIAAELREELRQEVVELKAKHNKIPGLTVILIGEMAPSQIYVRMKEKAANEVGLKSEVIRYPEAVEEKTVLHSMIQKGQMKNVVSEEQAAHFDIIVDFLNQQGYEHYEISNFAKPGHRSQHNSSYWKGAHYIGLGPSAHSYNGSTRQWNIANNALYAQSLKKGEINFEIESLELSTQFNEYMMISLRCMEGFDLTFIESKFGEAYLQHTNNIIAQLASQKVLSKTSEGYCLSKSAKFLADGIASEFFIVGSSPSL